jgi:hypothetical protein
MHLKVDNNNLITDIHLELWDLKALNKVVVDKIESFKNKQLNEFLKFSLNERLFKRIKIMYAMFPDYVVYFWASSPCYGTEHFNDLEAISKMSPPEKDRLAEVVIPTVKDEGLKANFILIDNLLLEVYTAQEKLKEIFVLEFPLEDAKKIALEFNLARNGNNTISTELIKGESRQLAEATFNDIKFIGIDKDDSSLHIIDGSELKIADNDFLSQFSGFYPAKGGDESNKEELELIIKHINVFKKSIKSKKNWFLRLLGF